MVEAIRSIEFFDFWIKKVVKFFLILRVIKTNNQNFAIFQRLLDHLSDFLNIIVLLFCIQQIASPQIDDSAFFAGLF